MVFGEWTRANLLEHWIGELAREDEAARRDQVKSFGSAPRSPGGCTQVLVLYILYIPHHLSILHVDRLFCSLIHFCPLRRICGSAIPEQLFVHSPFELQRYNDNFVFQATCNNQELIFPPIRQP